MAEAVVAQNKAALDKQRIELDYTTIRSPVKGVVIDRRVNVGQTLVASSSSSPACFSLESGEIAGVGQRQRDRHRQGPPGATVRLTVDAYPGKVFEGEVKQVRLNATMSQNAVRLYGCSGGFERDEETAPLYDGETRVRVAANIAQRQRESPLAGTGRAGAVS